MKLIHNKQRGASLAELLCVLGLLGCFVAFAASSISISRKTSDSAKKIFDRHVSLSGARFFLQKAVFASDTHRLDVAPRIHKAGQVSYADLTPHPVMSLGSATRPKNGSDAISATAVIPGVVLEVDSPATGSTLSNLRVCAAFTIPVIPIVSFLTISKRGVAYFVGQSRRDGDRCLVINASEKTHHSLLQSMPMDAPFLTLLPIASEFVIYVDTSNQLRYVSFSGDSLLENQPIVAGIASLNLTLSTSKHVETNFYNVEAKIALVDGFTAIETFRGRIGRHSHWNTLLWSF